MIFGVFDCARHVLQECRNAFFNTTAEFKRQRRIFAEYTPKFYFQNVYSTLLRDSIISIFFNAGYITKFIIAENAKVIAAPRR